MSAPLVEAERQGEICIVRLNRAEKLNAISTEVEQALGEALAGDDVTGSACVVLTGTGRAFSAGADISEFAERDPAAIARYYRETGGVYEVLAGLPQPTISALHGYCLGGGLELALATDLRVADRTAVLGFPEVGIGILPSSGGTVRATRLLGPARAKQLILLGEPVTAADALDLGLVTEVVPEGKALERACELAHALAARPRLALSVAKQAIDAVAESPGQGSLLIERLAYGLLAQTAEARAAADEFTRD